MIFARPGFGLGQPGRVVVTWGLGIAVVVRVEAGEDGLPYRIPEQGEFAEQVGVTTLEKILSGVPGQIEAAPLYVATYQDPEKVLDPALARLQRSQLYLRGRSGLDKLESSAPGQRSSGAPEPREKDCR